MIDYSIFFRNKIAVNNLNSDIEFFDILISAYNVTDRVNNVFEQVNAKFKYWYIHPEYKFSPLETSLLRESVIFPPDSQHNKSDIVQVNTIIDKLILDHGETLITKKICIDITGFMRHVIIFLFIRLSKLGVKIIHALYSEPNQYVESENTEFATCTTGNLINISGTRGKPDSDEDYVVIGVGYDSKLINEVTNLKDGAHFYPLYSFPSLSADMFQQSVICAGRSGEISSSESWRLNKSFAPANDPFFIAQKISSIIKKIDTETEKKPYITLVPLATKVQALGFCIYWLLEGVHRKNVTIMLPEIDQYKQETSVGIKRCWHYVIEV